jgi:hypothetical protein
LWSGSSFDTLIKNTYHYHNHQDKPLSDTTVKHLARLTTSKFIILLGGGRSESTLKTRIPTTYGIYTDVKAAADHAKTLLTDDVLAHYSVSKSAWQYFLAKTGLSRMLKDITDTKIRAVLVPEDSTKKAYEKATEAINTLNWANFKSVTAPVMDTNSDRKDPTADLTKKYPLVDAISAWGLNDTTRKHIITYLNAVHAETEAAAATPPVPVDTSVTV